MTKTKKTRNKTFTDKDFEKMIQQIYNLCFGKTSLSEERKEIFQEHITRQLVLSLSKKTSKRILHDLMWKMVDNYGFKKYSMNNFCSKILDDSSLMHETYAERGYE